MYREYDHRRLVQTYHSLEEANTRSYHIPPITRTACTSLPLSVRRTKQPTDKQKPSGDMLPYFSTHPELRDHPLTAFPPPRCAYVHEESRAENAHRQAQPGARAEILVPGVIVQARIGTDSAEHGTAARPPGCFAFRALSRVPRIEGASKALCSLSPLYAEVAMPENSPGTAYAAPTYLRGRGNRAYGGRYSRDGAPGTGRPDSVRAGRVLTEWSAEVKEEGGCLLCARGSHFGLGMGSVSSYRKGHKGPRSARARRKSDVQKRKQWLNDRALNACADWERRRLGLLIAEDGVAPERSETGTPRRKVRAFRVLIARCRRVGGQRTGLAAVRMEAGTLTSSHAAARKRRGNTSASERGRIHPSRVWKAWKGRLRAARRGHALEWCSARLARVAQASRGEGCVLERISDQNRYHMWASDSHDAGMMDRAQPRLWASEGRGASEGHRRWLDMGTADADARAIGRCRSASLAVGASEERARTDELAFAFAYAVGFDGEDEELLCIWPGYGKLDGTGTERRAEDPISLRTRRGPGAWRDTFVSHWRTGRVARSMDDGMMTARLEQEQRTVVYSGKPGGDTSLRKSDGRGAGGEKEAGEGASGA
ncbi:hypothetical protein FKP32DRAFT_1603631 [Trametes sanguinea]|nr:hypothetical protein FKP32DRAFT_1603631 [Trametes sanguinea]